MYGKDPFTLAVCVTLPESGNAPDHAAPPTEAVQVSASVTDHVSCPARRRCLCKIWRRVVSPEARMTKVLASYDSAVGYSLPINPDIR